MTKKIKKLFTKIIVFFLNILGITAFVSCDGLIKLIDVPVMYGMPANYHSVYGTVRGEDADGDGVGDPVSGIQYSYEGQTLENTYDAEGNVTGTKLPVTDEEGCFYIDYIDDVQSITVSFKDIDGEENGSYNDKEETFTFSDNKTEMEQDVNLEAKK